jgi:hypothetical protein
MILACLPKPAIDKGISLRDVNLVVANQALAPCFKNVVEKERRQIEPSLSSVRIPRFASERSLTEDQHVVTTDGSSGIL